MTPRSDLMLKKIVMWFFALILLILVSGAAFFAHEWYAKPFFINNYFNRLALKIALDSPETLTSLHFLEPLGIDGHNAELDDASPESTDEFFKFIASEHEVLKSYPDDSLTDEQKMSKRIAMYLFEFAAEAEAFKLYNYPVNQLFGIQSDFPSFMEAQHQVNNLDEAEYYVERLKKLPRKFEQSLEGIRQRTEHGIIPPRFVIEKVLIEMENFANTKTEENILYKSLQDKLAKLDSIEQAEKDVILEDAKNAIENEVYPAYVNLGLYFSGLSDKADDRDGFWKLPDGDQAYRLALKLFTSTDYSPDYIHNVGIQEVARIQQEMLDILKGEGFDTSKGFSETIEALADQPRFYYSDDAEGRKQILADYQSIIKEIEQ